MPGLRTYVQPTVVQDLPSRQRNQCWGNEGRRNQPTRTQRKTAQQVTPHLWEAEDEERRGSWRADALELGDADANMDDMILNVHIACPSHFSCRVEIDRSRVVNHHHEVIVMRGMGIGGASHALCLRRHPLCDNQLYNTHDAPCIMLMLMIVSDVRPHVYTHVIGHHGSITSAMTRGRG